MLIVKVKHFLKSEFAVALSTTSLTTSVQVLVGLIINKVLALTIGPDGIALMGQFTNFKELATNLANGSFGQGITKYIADRNTDNKKVLATSNLFTLCVSIIIGITIIISSGRLSELLFKTNKFIYIFILFGITIPFFAFNNLLIATVNGYRDFKTLAKIKITNSIVALCISVFLVWFYLLDGALIAQAVNTSIVFIVSFALIYHVRRNFFSFNIEMLDKGILKKLLGFTFMALTSSQLKPLVQLFIRDYIITHAGEFDAGIWEATKRLSDYYTQVITVALSAYYLPKLSSINTRLGLKNEIWYGIKVTMPVIIALTGSIFMLKSWIVLLLFSSDFILMENLILPQLIGDIFMICSFMIAYLMLAKAMVKLFMVSQILFAGIRVFLSIVFFNVLGIEGVIWANAINYALYLTFVVIVFRKILFAKAK